MMMSERSNHEKRSVARVVGSREILPSQFNPVDPFFFAILFFLLVFFSRGQVLGVGRPRENRN